MCNEAEHHGLLKALDSVERYLKQLCTVKQPQDQTIQISATVPYIIDYRGFRYIYLYSASTLTLSIEDLGQVLVPANTWSLLNFSEGIRCFAMGQTTNTTLFVRCTDERLVSPGSGGISSTNISQWGGVATSLGQKVSASSVPVVVASDQSTLPANISQWGGSAVGLANPIITEDQIRAYIANGQGFAATTTKLTAGGALTGGLSVFNPNASGKTLIIYSILFMIGNNSFNQINFTTSDPALGTSVPANNLKSGGAAGVTVCSDANTNVVPAGTQIYTVGAASNAQTQVLQPGLVFVIPANNGLALYTNLSGTNSWFVTISWLEV